jgi:predicted metal-binding membrane protein
LSRSDIGFCIMVAMAGSAPAVIGVFSGMWWLMALGIMLAPLSFMFRGGRKRPSEQKS